MTEGWAAATGSQVRSACRSSRINSPTAGMADGYVQANLVMVPSSLADDFQLFCDLNPIPCPLLERTPVGVFEPVIFAPGSDIRTDAARYMVYRNGLPDSDKPVDVSHEDTSDLAGFLIGCSFTFEAAMAQAGFELRHQKQGVNVPMYRTSLACTPVGSLEGPMVVSMRPIAKTRVAEVRDLTAQYARVHGAPIHVGDPAAIGIASLNKPDWGDAVEMQLGEVPVFWGCGVTPQAVAQASKPELMITHAPGHMFVTDVKDVELQKDEI